MLGDMAQSSERTRFEQLLPFYLANTLSDDDRAFVQSYSAVHPNARKAIEFTEHLRRIVRNTGAHRNPEAALNRLLGNYTPRQRANLIKRLLAKLRSLGISLPVAVALLFIVGQGGVVVAKKMGWFTTTTEAVTAYANAHLSVTAKQGVDMGAIAVILEQFGGRIVHSTAAVGVKKFFIELIDKTKIQALIDALIDAGLIDAAAILL